MQGVAKVRTSSAESSGAEVLMPRACLLLTIDAHRQKCVGMFHGEPHLEFD